MQAVGSRGQPSRTDRTTRDELDQLAAYLMFTWSVLRPPTVHAWNEDLVLVLDGSVPWLMGPAEHDPLRGHRGSSVLPRAARTKLEEIEGLRVPFQRVAFAHELDPLGPVEPLLPALRAGPQICTAETARGLVGDVPVHPGVAGIVSMLNWVARGPRRSADPAPRHRRAGLSRIVFGVMAPVAPRNGQLCLWFPLTAWRW